MQSLLAFVHLRHEQGAMTEDDLRLALLKQRKLFGTQKEMAKALGVSEQNLGRFITGKQGIRMHKMLEALGLECATVTVIRPKEAL
jgi:DNA-binding transcriptional regulator YdaS (Cro superfamily)